MTVKRKRATGWAEEFPSRHCFTSHCTEQENLSYASAFHIAFTIYVPGRIMQLDGSVEKTPINLILFSIFFFFLPFFLFQRPCNPLSLCSLAFICSSLFPDFLCKGIQQQAFVSCLLYSAELVNTKSTLTHTKTHSRCPSHTPSRYPGRRVAHRSRDLFLLKCKWLSLNTKYYHILRDELAFITEPIQIQPFHKTCALHRE